MARNHYTQSYRVGEVKTVKVAEFREQIRHLEQIVQADWHACTGAAEQAACVERAQRVGSELIAMHCSRATEDDMERRERIIERSTTLIVRHLESKKGV